MLFYQQNKAPAQAGGKDEPKMTYVTARWPQGQWVYYGHNYWPSYSYLMVEQEDETK
jgi:hypothetical protein